MIVKRVTALVVLAGCSFAWHDFHRGAPPKSVSDCPGHVYGVLDTVGVGAFGFVTVEAIVHKDEPDSAAAIFVVPALLATLVYAASAAYGFWLPGGCARAVGDQ
jgi:hypothetical protein